VIVTEVVVVVQMQFRVVIGFALQTSVRRNTGERTEQQQQQQQHPFNWRVGWDTRGVAKIKKKKRTKLRSKTEQKRKMKEKV
jgi:negative regulator of sigma E activity